MPLLEEGDLQYHIEIVSYPPFIEERWPSLPGSRPKGSYEAGARRKTCPLVPHRESAVNPGATLPDERREREKNGLAALRRKNPRILNSNTSLSSRSKYHPRRIPNLSQKQGKKDSRTTVSRRRENLLGLHDSSF